MYVFVHESLRDKTGEHLPDAQHDTDDMDFDARDMSFDGQVVLNTPPSDTSPMRMRTPTPHRPTDRKPDARRPSEATMSPCDCPSISSEVPRHAFFDTLGPKNDLHFRATVADPNGDIPAPPSDRDAFWVAGQFQLGCTFAMMASHLVWKTPMPAYALNAWKCMRLDGMIKKVDKLIAEAEHSETNTYFKSFVLDGKNNARSITDNYEVIICRAQEVVRIPLTPWRFKGWPWSYNADRAAMAYDRCARLYNELQTSSYNAQFLASNNVPAPRADQEDLYETARTDGDALAKLVAEYMRISSSSATPETSTDGAAHVASTAQPERTPTGEALSGSGTHVPAVMFDADGSVTVGVVTLPSSLRSTSVDSADSSISAAPSTVDLAADGIEEGFEDEPATPTVAMPVPSRAATMWQGPPSLEEYHPMVRLSESFWKQDIRSSSPSTI